MVNACNRDVHVAISPNAPVISLGLPVLSESTLCTRHLVQSSIVTHMPLTIISLSSDGDEAAAPSMTEKFVDETQVLKPIRSDVAGNSDDWPIFRLKECVIYKSDCKTMVSLLEAELEGPFTVRGLLRVDKKTRSLSTTEFYLILIAQGSLTPCSASWAEEYNMDRGQRGSTVFYTRWPRQDMGCWCCWLVRNSTSKCL